MDGRTNKPPSPSLNPPAIGKTICGTSGSRFNGFHSPGDHVCQPKIKIQGNIPTYFHVCVGF